MATPTQKPSSKGPEVTSGPDRDFARFQLNLRRTALGVKFAQEILKNPSKITPKTASDVLRLLGFPIPKDLIMAQDAIQAVITGAAVIERATEASNWLDFQDIVKPGVGSMRVLVGLARETGLMDKDTAMQLTLAGDVACIYASGGTDVGAWVRVALNVHTELEVTKQEATIAAKKAVLGLYSSEMQKQGQAFASAVKQWQDGELGIFSFLAKTAVESSLIFPNLILQNDAFKTLREKLPGLNSLPVGQWTFKASKAESTFWGESVGATETISVMGLAQFNESEIVDRLLHHLIAPTALAYLNARNYFLRMGKADIFNLAMLAQFDSSVYLSGSMNFTDLFARHSLTPYEIGERGVFVGTDFASSAVFTDTLLGSRAFNRLTTAQMNALDQQGSIMPLIHDAEAEKRLRRRFETWTTPEVDKHDAPFNWRNFANFMSVLEFMDMVYIDPKFQELKSRSMYLQKFSVFPELRAFNERIDFVYKASMVRKVNQMAMQNVAYFLNAPPSKIEKSVQIGQPSVFKVKG